MGGPCWTQDEEKIFLQEACYGLNHLARCLPNRSRNSIRMRLVKFKLPTKTKYYWTKEEDDIVEREAAFGLKHLAKILPGRTTEAIKQRVIDAGGFMLFRRRRRTPTAKVPKPERGWTPVEDTIISNEYPHATRNILSKLLPKRTYMAICARALKLNVRRQTKDYSRQRIPNAWTEDELRKLDYVYRFATKEDLSWILPNRSLSSIFNKAYRLGLAGPFKLPSRGEAAVRRFLTAQEIEYCEQKTFFDLRNPKTGRHLFYDFYLHAKNVLIEFDGYQHYVPRGGSERHILEFELLKERDLFKNRYAEERGIPLLRIPYTTKLSDVGKMVTNTLASLLRPGEIHPCDPCRGSSTPVNREA